MRCPRCQHLNPADAAFCEECGVRLEAPCPSCGEANRGGAKFCKRCGERLVRAGAAQPAAGRFASPESYTPRHLAEKILTSKAALEGERKQVTVLFADLKGSMELFADRDPEEGRRLLDPVLERMIEAVHRFEGTVNQVMGDGIMALFGAPLAHEDHAVRACYAALRMQEAMRRYNEDVRRSHGVEIQIRVGLNSGDVVVRSIGSDLHMDYTAVGHTTQLAARMEQLAIPGTTRLTVQTLRLAEGYVQVRPLGAIPVKGLAEPIEAYEAIGPGPARSRLQAAAARGLTRFVGRDAELEELRRALERTGSGHGQVLAVLGEAGVGKSRLFWEFTHSHRVEGWLIVESGSVSYGKATPYLPLIELLRVYFQIEPRDDARRVREKVTGKVLALDRTLEVILPGMLELLDVAVEDRDWQALDPPSRRRRTLDAVRRLLVRESQVQPVIALFEDLHWIDSETQAFLDRLVESLPTARLLLLVNYRPEYQHGWGNKTYYRQLHIDPLRHESAEELLRALLGDEAALTPLKRLLFARTAGNPFFLEESVRGLEEARVLVGERGSYRLAEPLGDIQVPATVQAVLAARIDRLVPEEKRLLQTAAVIGKDVPYPLLRTVVEASEEALAQGLAHLIAGEFLYEASLFPELEYTFTHALTHEVAYQGLLQERQRALHRRILEVMESLYADRLIEQVERLAHHALKAGDWAKAVRYLREAGGKAAGRWASLDAIAFFEQGLAAVARLPETGETLSDALDLRLALGPLLTGTKGGGDMAAGASYTAARELCERVGDTTRLFPVLWGLWFGHYTRGDNRGALDLAERLLDLTEQGSDSGRRLEAHHCLWATLIGMGEPGRAQPHLNAGFSIYDLQQHRSLAALYGGHDPGVCCRNFAAWSLWELGYPDQARTRVHEALALARQLSQPVTNAIALSFAAFVHHQRGEFTVASEHADAMLGLTEAQGIAAWKDQASALLTILAIEQGGAAGVPALSQGGLTLGRSGRAAAWRQMFSLTLLAGAYGRAGRPEQGLEALSQAWAIAGENPDGFYASELHRLKGDLSLQTRGEEAARDAEACFHRALEIARARQARSLELRAATSLARFLGHRGKGEEARRLVADTYGWFTEGFDTKDLVDARALLDQLGR